MSTTPTPTSTSYAHKLVQAHEVVLGLKHELGETLRKLDEAKEELEKQFQAMRDAVGLINIPSNETHRYIHDSYLIEIRRTGQISVMPVKRL